MVKFNYGKAQKTSNKLIDKFGALGAILRYPDYEPEPVTLVVTNYSNRQVDGTRILQSDRLILVAPLSPNGGMVGVPLANQDRVRDAAGVDYEIINCNPVAPAGTVVLIEVQGRA